MNSDESVYETKLLPADFNIRRELINKLTSDLNQELLSLTSKFGDIPFTNLISLIVDALANLEELLSRAQELNEVREQLTNDLKCLEHQYEKMKKQRKSYENDYLQFEIENEEEKAILKNTIGKQTELIKSLQVKFNEQLLEHQNGLKEMKDIPLDNIKVNYDQLTNENYQLVKENIALSNEIESLQDTISSFNVPNTRENSIEKLPSAQESDVSYEVHGKVITQAGDSVNYCENERIESMDQVADATEQNLEINLAVPKVTILNLIYASNAFILPQFDLLDFGLFNFLKKTIVERFKTR